jgi:hypothetical protein|nr:hypothetical protein [uncultured Prevotella sp.]
MRINIIILFLCFTFIFPCKVHAGVDPARAALIFSLQKRQERWYKAQAAAIAANIEGHTFVAKQVKGISDLNKEYDEFLTDIDTLLNYVGTTYGLYIQVKETIKAVRDLKTALRKHPTGLLATSLSARKNSLILDVGDTTGKLINDIRDVFLRKENRISKKARITILEGIRGNITTLNRKLWMLSRAITYTSLVDDWNEFVGLATSYKTKSRETICKEAMRRWSRAANMSIR